MGSTGGDFLAPRAAAALRPSLSYWGGFFKALSDLWTPDNPSGFIPLVIAENRLSTDLMKAGLLTAGQHGWPNSLLYYQDARGLMDLRTTVARMLEATFMQGVAVDARHVSIFTGVGSVLDLLLHCVGSPGEVVLIPAPFYPAFDNDLSVRNQLVPQAVHLDLECQDFSAGLDEAAAAAEAAGRRVAAVLVTNPTNPQGALLSRAQVASALAWCLARRVHCISDEIYANSVFQPGAEFVSAAQVDTARMEGGELAGELLHVLFGASKDFAGSGLRVGGLWSRNAGLNTALDNLGYFASPPAPTQWTLARLLSDDAWLRGFLAENRRRLKATYDRLTNLLDAAGIAYTPAAAGMFLWLDLRAAFGGARGSWQDEAALWDCMVDTHRVVLTPGAACHAAEPGWFRMCWAWPPPESLPAAVSRVAAAVAEVRALHLERQRTAGAPDAAAGSRLAEPRGCGQKAAAGNTST